MTNNGYHHVSIQVQHTSALALSTCHL